MDMIIAGQRIGGGNRQKINVTNPATGAIIRTVPVATQADIDYAVRRSLIGQRLWQNRPMHERISILEKFADLLETHSLQVAETETAEMGKPIAQSIAEVKSSVEMVRNFNEHARTLGGEVLPISSLPSAEKDVLITLRVPYGVVAAIIPFNYPVSSNLLKTVPALLMGNAVLVKPSSEAPLANILLVQQMLDAGVPADVIQIITGPGEQIGRQLASDTRIALISLTGSTKTGIEISRYSAGNLKRVLLELGGNDPLLLLEDVDMDYAVQEAISGRFGNAGQVCCASKRFLVPRERKAEFVSHLIFNLRQKRIGNPMDYETQMGPLVSERAAQKVEEQLHKTVEQGGKILYGGHRLQGAYFEPTVLEVPKHAEILGSMEVFGPVWPVVVYDTLDEGIEIANQTCYGLSAGVIGRDYQMLWKAARAIQAGCCVLNGSGNYQTKDQGFGGMKLSGGAREGGRYSLEEMSQIKTLVFRRAFEDS